MLLLLCCFFSRLRRYHSLNPSPSSLSAPSVCPLLNSPHAPHLSVFFHSSIGRCPFCSFSFPSTFHLICKHKFGYPDDLQNDTPSVQMGISLFSYIFMRVFSNYHELIAAKGDILIFFPRLSCPLSSFLMTCKQ